MSDSSPKSSGGIGFLSLLTLIFVVAKLWHVVTWSWWIVLSPVLVPTALVLACLLILLIVAGCAALIDHNSEQKALAKNRAAIKIGLDGYLGDRWASRVTR